MNLLDYRSHRREHLCKHYYFACACPRCSDEEGGERAMFCVSCAECGGDSVYLGEGAEENEQGDKDQIEITKSLNNNSSSSCSRIGVCPDCGHVMDASAIERYRETFELVDDKINAGGSTGIGMNLVEFCFRQMAKARIASD